MVNPIEVDGGPGGITAHLEDLRLAADRPPRSLMMSGIWPRNYTPGWHPALLISAGLIRIGAGEVSAAIFRATDGPGGVTARAARRPGASPFRASAVRKAVDDLTRLAGPIPS
jgi:hypothetical protein